MQTIPQLRGMTSIIRQLCMMDFLGRIFRVTIRGSSVVTNESVSVLYDSDTVQDQLLYSTKLKTYAGNKFLMSVDDPEHLHEKNKTKTKNERTGKFRAFPHV